MQMLANDIRPTDEIINGNIEVIRYGAQHLYRYGTLSRLNPTYRYFRCPYGFRHCLLGDVRFLSKPGYTICKNFSVKHEVSS